MEVGLISPIVFLKHCSKNCHKRFRLGMIELSDESSTEGEAPTEERIEA